jgi:hypothetical protein
LADGDWQGRVDQDQEVQVHVSGLSAMGALRWNVRWITLAVGVVLSQNAAGAIYQEVGDAPPVVPGQPTIASPLDGIHGVLSGALDVDLYFIFIADPVAFSAAVVADPAFDSQLFLFNPGGIGILHDDDTPPGGVFRSTITGPIGFPAGFYVLGISAHDMDPESPGALPLWLDDPVFVQHPPDGPGVVLGAWSGAAVVDDGHYWIRLAGCTAATPVAQADAWNESADAPDLFPGQGTIGAGNLATILGSFIDSLDVDIYCINIVNPPAFSATTDALRWGDTQLFLFDASGRGITHNDDNPALGSRYSRISGGFVPGPGVYLLAISSYNRDPIGASTFPLWMQNPTFFERPADGSGSTETVAAWSGTGEAEGGIYAIALTGAAFCPTPPTEAAVPLRRDLAIRAFPNPFNPSVTISYFVPEEARVTVRVFDASGAIVRNLVDESRREGQYSFAWDGRGEGGKAVASGVYFIRLDAAGRHATKKVVLLK